MSDGRFDCRADSPRAMAAVMMLSTSGATRAHCAISVASWLFVA
jgi:hypothetical protein